MIPVREFTSAADMMAFYKVNNAQFRPKTKPVIIPEIPAVAPSPRAAGAVEKSVSTASPLPVVDPLAWARYRSKAERGPLWRSAPNRARRIVARIAHRAGSIVRVASKSSKKRRQMTAEDIFGPSRLSEVVEARFEAAERIYYATGWSLPQVARFLGGRDHTTIINALRKRNVHFRPNKYAPKTLRADISGLRFGSLVALGKAETRHQYARYWLCRCDCGGSITVRSDRLKNGEVKSCGRHRRGVAQ